MHDAGSVGSSAPRPHRMLARLADRVWLHLAESSWPWINVRSEEHRLLMELDPARIPRHVAIIMDGNGRWAQRRGLMRTAGHRAGVRSLKEAVRTCAKLGVEVLSVFAFSTENWQRPAAEVDMLMRLLTEVLREEIDEIDEAGVRVHAIGRLDGLPQDVVQQIRAAEARTRANRHMLLNVALNYGGRAEIVDAAVRLAQDVAAGKVSPETVDEESFSRYLYTAGLPDPDLLIRTGGEYRVSNFMLWQLAYSELWVTPVFWPDFRRVHLLQAIVDYQRRHRRFGKV
ncbi:isoprenyl transferase [Carboxydochorda subterranea]|uniref:Isoprenyl transferase n=1 Tax=Carboxydichorda subterranea TaxID=3109565 RepID=A0ABZ1C061_9FIRM|nr:isoprenyl transferase [Limnochorda sp. L945t]WRP18474.1 isoprenyl transferase [Limnochorda sp. L945t]